MQKLNLANTAGEKTKQQQQKHFTQCVDITAEHNPLPCPEDRIKRKLTENMNMI